MYIYCYTDTALTCINKSTAVAQMGDRFATIDKG